MGRNLPESWKEPGAGHGTELGFQESHPASPFVPSFPSTDNPTSFPLLCCVAAGRASPFLVWGWLWHPGQSVQLRGAACSAGGLMRAAGGSLAAGKRRWVAGCEGQASSSRTAGRAGKALLLGSVHPRLLHPKLPASQIISVHTWLERWGMRATWGAAKVPGLCQQSTCEGIVGSEMGLFVSPGHFSAPMSSEIGRACI